MSRTKFVRGAVAASLLATGAVAAMSPTPASAQTPNQTKAYIEVPNGATGFPVGNYSIAAADVALTGANTGLVFTMDDGTGTDFVLTLTPRTGGAGPFQDADSTTNPTPPENIETDSIGVATATQAAMTLTRGSSSCANPTGEFTLDGADLDNTAPATFGAAVRFTITCAGETAAYSAAGFAYFNQPAGPLHAAVAGEFIALDPVRLVDTRFTSRLGAAAALPIDTTTNLNGAPSTVPANALAVVLNLTAINPSSPTGTFLTVYPTGTARPFVSNLNPGFAETTANVATVKVGTGGSVTLYNELGTIDVAVDVIGYWLPDDPAIAGGTRYRAQTPVRKLDTREVSGGAAPLAAGATRTVRLNAGAAVNGAIVNLTVVAPTAGGYAAIFPGGTVGIPNVSNVNFTPGRTAANMVVTKVVNDEIMVHNPTAGTVHVVIDLIGTFDPPAALADQAGKFVPVEPVRAYDSRDPGDTPLGARVTRDVNLLSLRGLHPFEYTSVIANLTATGSTNPGYLTAFPAASTPPFVSNVNWPAAKTVANQFVSGTDLDGFTGFYHGADPGSIGGVDFIVDVAGYFTQG